MSASKTRHPARVNSTANVRLIELFPTPPFWLTTEMIMVDSFVLSLIRYFVAAAAILHQLLTVLIDVRQTKKNPRRSQVPVLMPCRASGITLSHAIELGGAAPDNRGGFLPGDLDITRIKPSNGGIDSGFVSCV
jgi:hypothetical protein